MAASSSKAPCATCNNKGVGIFKCEGCAQVFCRKHVIEHRDNLSNQLDEIVLEHDSLQQLIVEYNDKRNHCHPLINQIDKWERNAIEKIQKTAERARQQVNKLIGSQKETVPMDLHELAERLRKARTDDDYVETDLQTWKTKLEKLKRDITVVSPSISICEDPKRMLIAEIYVSATKQALELTERFGQFTGDIRIEKNGREAIHGDINVGSAYVRGTNEYSRDKHKVRFIIQKTTMYVMSFNIVSKPVALAEWWISSRYFAYGWRTDDYTNNSDKNIENTQGHRDLEDEAKLELELLIDCDNRKISYFNERTKTTREIDIDINKCPFPWMLQFYLYGTGDRVQLVSSYQVL